MKKGLEVRAGDLRLTEKSCFSLKEFRFERGGKDWARTDYIYILKM